jgi:hypothetical protein
MFSRGEKGIRPQQLSVPRRIHTAMQGRCWLVAGAAAMLARLPQSPFLNDRSPSQALRIYRCFTRLVSVSVPYVFFSVSVFVVLRVMGVVAAA